MTNEQQLKIYHDFALQLVRECGALFREGYEKDNSNFEIKSAHHDLVTVYDKQIEKHLITNLKAKFPESKFIGEEETSANKSILELSAEPTWIIDPIDGTTNFVYRIPHCCISLGLAIDKQLVVGIVYNPMANEMYSAYKGNGAYLNGKRIQVGKCSKVEDAIVGIEITFINMAKARDKNIKRLYKLGSICTGTRCLGSGALSLCYVAKGTFHCYPMEDLNPWDVAAGAIILQEAGGVLYNTAGQAFDFMQPSMVGACNKELADKVVHLIAEANEITGYTFE